MGLVRSVVTLVAVVLCIGFAYAVGHGLSTHEPMAFVIGAVLLLAGAAIIFGLSRQRGPEWGERT